MFAKPTIILLLRHGSEKCNVFRDNLVYFFLTSNYIRVWGCHSYTGMSVIVGWCQTISSWEANGFQMLYVSIEPTPLFAVS